MHAIRLVVSSFARDAPKDAVLAVKEHPLDNGVIHWRQVTQAAARDAGAVSYTHLDVYKRQRLSWTKRRLRRIGMWRPGFHWFGPAVQA